MITYCFLYDVIMCLYDLPTILCCVRTVVACVSLLRLCMICMCAYDFHMLFYAVLRSLPDVHMLVCIFLMLFKLVSHAKVQIKFSYRAEVAAQR